MWDDILEIVFEGILEISIDAAGHKGKGILIGLATLAWLAVTALLLWVGITESEVQHEKEQHSNLINRCIHSLDRLFSSKMDGREYSI